MKIQNIIKRGLMIFSILILIINYFTLNSYCEMSEQEVHQGIQTMDDLKEEDFDEIEKILNDIINIEGGKIGTYIVENKGKVAVITGIIIFIITRDD